MTDETGNLILEHLRSIRGDIADLRGDVNRRFGEVAGRIDTLETEVRGLNYIVTVAIGSLLHDMTDLKSRVGSLEKV